jgi:hypothetical protein
LLLSFRLLFSLFCFLGFLGFLLIELNCWTHVVYKLLSQKTSTFSLNHFLPFSTHSPGFLSRADHKGGEGKEGEEEHLGALSASTDHPGMIEM